jgi:hypothetical protein
MLALIKTGVLLASISVFLNLFKLAAHLFGKISLAAHLDVKKVRIVLGLDIFRIFWRHT